MKLVCLSFTRAGSQLGSRLEKSQEYRIKHIENKSIDGGIKSILEDLWKEYDGLIFISATGIALRYIAPYIEDKTRDPAIVIMDDMGKFSISLLSGHLGGANQLAEDLARFIGAMAVITTASDNRGFQSLDIFAQENNYYMEDMKTITKISSLMVDGREIGLYSEDSRIPDYPSLKIVENLGGENDLKIDGLIIISSSKLKEETKAWLKKNNIVYTILRPKNLNLGIGCRKGVSSARIIEAIKESLENRNLSIRSLKAMATVEVKKDEVGLIEAAKHFDLDLEIFSLEEIETVEDKFKKSQFVKDTIGVYSVSEPSAYLLGGEFLERKGSYDGITISITKERKNG